jgi:glycosyltransferase involved in cell wall biosynthesis
MNRSHAIDALSGSIRNGLIERGIDGTKINVAPCSFTDLSLCRPAPHKEKWVVFLARFIDEKDPLLLARSIPQVQSRVPDAHFYFLGQGPLQEELEHCLEEHQVAEHATIQFVAQPTDILNRASVFASLQVVENYPSQSLLEAMACGNAVVATDVSETWRLVDETNGRRVPPTPDAVAEAIIELLDDPRLAQYQAGSRKRVLTEYTPERFFEYITRVYQIVVGQALANG